MAIVGAYDDRSKVAARTLLPGCEILACLRDGVFAATTLSRHDPPIDPGQIPARA